MRPKHASGFSLIEMIVVIALVIIFTSILVVYSGSGRRQIEFFNEQSLLTNAVFRAKSFAIETFQPGQSVFSDLSSDEIICGWGIHFERNSSGDSYTIFRDLDVSGSSNPCTHPSVGAYDIGTNEIFEEFSPDATVATIKCMVLNFSVGASCLPASGLNSLDVFFMPPEPKVIFTPFDPSYAEAVIILELVGGGRCSEIRVTKAGQINVEEVLSC